MRSEMMWNRYKLIYIWTAVIDEKKKPGEKNQNYIIYTSHQIAALLGATCCALLSATPLWHVATCWVSVLLAQIWPTSNLSQQHPTYCNTSQHAVAKGTQHVAPNNVVIFDVDMLQPFSRGFSNTKSSWDFPFNLDRIPVGNRGLRIFNQR